MLTPPTAHEPQYHYGRGRGGRPRGGHAQSFAHQQHAQHAQHAQPYNAQYTSPQWQQQQPYYSQQNGAYNPYAAQPFNPYLNNAAYYNQQYNNYPYYPQGTGYPGYIPPQPPAMYGNQAHQSPYQQSQYAMPQQPITNGPNSPFSQPHLPAAQPMNTTAPSVPLTPASAHSSQFVPAPPTDIALRGGLLHADNIAQSPQDDQLVNGDATAESDPTEQPTAPPPVQTSPPIHSEIPTPNPKAWFGQVCSNSIDLPVAEVGPSLVCVPWTLY